jgi:hypothetical protein
MGEVFVDRNEKFVLFAVNENDGMDAAGNGNYRPGQAENSP